VKAIVRMPYMLEKVKGGYKVMTTAGKNKGHEHSKKPLSHMMATKQLKALYYHMRGESMK
jgi:hypothetical protein